ncbi:MAG: hypothetical protein RIA69_01335 [Cyclobacteriaceae bacterium]
MKKTILLILGFSFAISLHAQKQWKYEEYLPEMLALPPSGAIALLKTYRATEPENGSIHLQLASIYKERYSQADPIKEYQYKIGNAQLALDAYTLAQQIITEKDVRKNDENYYNFGKINSKGKLEVSYDSIANIMATSKASLEKYIANGPTIYEKFTESFSHYDRAHKLFTEVVGEYTTFKDLYLLFDEDLNVKFEEIKKEYLASIAFFEEYKLSTDAYPINYNQTLVIEDISVYRLDGLESQINFLEPKITLWDYASWVDKTRAIIGNEITSLRQSLIDEDLRLDQRLNGITAAYGRDDYEELKVNKEVLFNLRKYDLNSVIEPIYLYKEKKHDQLYHALLSKSLDTTKGANLDRRLFVYGQLVNKLIESDSSLAKITIKNDNNSTKKFNAFITQRYTSQQGINDFVRNQKAEIATNKKNYINLIQDNILLDIWGDTVQQNIVFKKKNIPLMISPAPDTVELQSVDYITTHKVVNFDSSAFVSGVFLHPKEKKIAAFVAGVTSDGKIGWFNEYLIQIDSGTYDADTRVGAIAAVPGGIALVLNGAKDLGQNVNELTLINEQGETTFKKRLNIKDYPRSINYNEIENTIFIAFKGAGFEDDIFIENQLVAANFNILGDLQWQHRFKYKGDLTSVVNIGEAYILLGNYNEMRDLTGRINGSGPDNQITGVFFMTLNKSGIADIKFLKETGVCLLKTIKVSNDCINLFGNKGKYNKYQMLNSEPGDWFHVILNRNLVELSNNL